MATRPDHSTGEIHVGVFLQFALQIVGQIIPVARRRRDIEKADAPVGARHRKHGIRIFDIGVRGLENMRGDPAGAGDDLCAGI